MGEKQGRQGATRKRWWRRMRLLALTLTLLLTTVVMLAQFAAPIIEKNHARIEAWISHELGHQVQFGQMRLRVSGISPVISLTDFTIKTQHHGPHWLQVQRMQFAIDWRKSVVKRELRLGKWLVSGVNLQLAHMSPGDGHQDRAALFVTLDRWLGKHPVYLQAVRVDTTRHDGQALIIVFDELQMNKQKGKVTDLEQPRLRPWLTEAVKQTHNAKKLKQIHIKGKAHLLGEKQSQIQFMGQTAPYVTATKAVAAKFYVKLDNLALRTLPRLDNPLLHSMGDSQLTAKAWIDIQQGRLAAVQTTFKMVDPLPAVNPVHHDHTATIAGHLYALKDTEKGWWITADNIEVKTTKHKPIQGEFAMQYRAVNTPDIDWLVKVPKFRFTQGSGHLSGQFQWHQPLASALAVGKPVPQAYLKLDAKARNFPVLQMMPLIPRQALPPALFEWLAHAPKAGLLTQAVVNIDGGTRDLRQGNQAVLRGSGEISKAKVKFHPRWPSLSADKVQWTLENNQLTFAFDGARTNQQRIDTLGVKVAPLFDSKKVSVDLNVASAIDLQKTTRFIHKTSLADSVGQRLAPVKLVGPARLALEVSIALARPHHRPPQVHGSLGFSQAGLQLKDWPVIINRLSGDVQFTEKTLQAPRITGTLWGEPITLSLSNALDRQASATQVNAQTTLALPALVKAFPALDSLPMLGSINSTIAINIPDDARQGIGLSMTSDLKGLHIALPAPLGKTTSQAKPSRMQVQLLPNRNNHFEMRYADDQVRVEVHQLPGNASKWEFAFDSPEALGKATLSLLPNQESLRAVFKKLHIKQQTQPKSQHTLDPRSLPVMSLLIDDFQLDNKRLGKLTLNTRPGAEGQVITKLQTESRALTINASGDWRVQNNKHRTTLTGTFATHHFEQAVKALGFTPSVQSDKARVDFTLNWPGAPYAFAMTRLGGSASFKINEGRVKNVSKQTSQMIGVGRMLNMLSLSSIPKRLRLNFSDLTEKGFHFDEFKGTVLILNGNATTTNAHLDGQVARIRWKGRVGLAAQDYDLIMRVEPHMTSSLPVVAVIAGGPVVGPVAGVATWMMNKAIAPDLERLSSYDYTIKGKWSEPIVRPLDASSKSHRAPIVSRSG